jgi:triosephosphate isomerase
MTHYVLGNWKMNTTLDEARHLFQALPTGLPGVQVGVAAPFPWLVPLATAPDRNPAWLGAQDISAETSGAFTGETSIAMLSPYCDFVLIGHSERRQYHPESPEHIQRKVQQVISADRVAVLCVGENLQQRQSGQAIAIVHQQLNEALGNIDVMLPDHLLVAYEPVWAIGTGVAATADDAGDMGAQIATFLQEFPATGTTVPILYGGSVTPENATSILAQSPIGGLLVGGASLDARKFRSICEAAAN